MQTRLNSGLIDCINQMTARGIHRGIVALGLPICECGNVKNRKHSFCERCYSQLTPEMQFALYRLSGNGYEEAYDSAIKLLRNRMEPKNG